MKYWLTVLAVLPLAAQEPKAADTSSQPPTAAAEPSPIPAEPQGITGSIDFGYRWVTGVGGSLDTYRSVVNLGQGPKLFGLDLTFESASRRWFDRINVRGSNWGGDPYNTAHVDATRHDWYSFSFDYRNIAYFNFLPSFADPTAGNGVYLDQQSFDSHRRMSNFELELRPGKRIVPYLSYSRDSGFGTGITDFVGDINNYAVSNLVRDKTDNYRGGVRIEMPKFHVTLEQGGSVFKDDQQVLTGNENFGNRTTPFFGEHLYLADLAQAYGIRGDSIYSKVLLTANPASWIDVFGQFLYSRPDTSVNYAQFNTGNFVDLSSLLFFTGELDLLTAAAKQPHTTGTFGFELRPARRLRIIESWMTDRLHNAPFASLTSQILTPAMSAQLSTFSDPLVWNYSQQQVDVLFDVTTKMTVRGGYRYVWGDAETRGPLVSELPQESGALSHQVGLAGITYRPRQNLSFNVDFEGASGDRAYFRTSLNDYQRARVRARYQPMTSLVVSAAFSVLNNQNPAPSVNLDFLSHDSSVAVMWSPRSGKRLTFSGEYTRSMLRSDITYLVPETFQSAISFYRDNAHIAAGTADLVIPGFGERSPRLSLGGSFFFSSGSRPTQYYQPLMRCTESINKHLTWYTEWRWYGFAEPFYLYEGFRTHLFATGLRVTR